MSLKNNEVTAFLAKKYFDLRTRDLKKLIFTATTGRSGTMSLARVFSRIPGCIAQHEPYPIMNGEVLKAASYGASEDVDRFYRRSKSVCIRRAAVGYRYYFEANHLFIKTFAQQVVDDFGDRVSVVHLIRSPLEVAMSIFRLQDYPGTKDGNYWWLDYRAPSNHIKIIDLLDTHKEFSHPFYKALWYWFEVEVRIAEWQKRMPSIPFLRFETNWLYRTERIFELLDRLKIEYEKSAIEEMTGTQANSREDQKRAAPLAQYDSERMLRLFQEVLAQRGIALPPTFETNVSDAVRSAAT